MSNTTKKKILWSSLCSPEGPLGPTINQSLFEINLDFWKAANEFGFERPRRLPVVGRITTYVCGVQDYYYMKVKGKLTHMYTIGMEKRGSGVDLFLTLNSGHKLVIKNLVETEEGGQKPGTLLFYAYRKHLGMAGYANIQDAVVESTKGPVLSMEQLSEYSFSEAARTGFLTKACYNKCVRHVINEHKRLASLFAGRYGDEARNAVWKDDADFGEIEKFFYTIPNLYNRNLPQFPHPRILQTQQLKERRECSRLRASSLEGAWLHTS